MSNFFELFFDIRNIPDIFEHWQIILDLSDWFQIGIVIEMRSQSWPILFYSVLTAGFRFRFFFVYWLLSLLWWKGGMCKVFHCHRIFLYKISFRGKTLEHLFWGFSLRMMSFWWKVINQDIWRRLLWVESPVEMVGVVWSIFWIFVLGRFV